jgi:hypothetical protein
MTIESFDREARLQKKAQRKGFDLTRGRSTDTTRRTWTIRRAGILATKLSLDQAEEFLKTDRR